MRHLTYTVNNLGNLDKKHEYLSPSIELIRLPASLNLLVTLSAELEVDEMEDLGSWD